MEVAYSRHSPSHGRFTRATVGGLFILGFVLSLLSAWQVCTSSCAEAHQYRFFGFHFEIFGISFFIAAFAAFLFSAQWPWLLPLVKTMVAASIGAELRFVHVQKNVIGHWCPLCLTIAATLALIGLIFFVQYAASFQSIANDLERRDNIMKKILAGLTSVAAGILGFAIAIFGVAKPERSFAEANTRGESPIFGKTDSNIEVYLFTDWFCPACSKTEPELAKQFPAIMKKARLLFVDVPIHEDSENFLPYNISFMLKNKKQYLELRKALQKLAETNHAPTERDIEAMATSVGAAYKPLAYSEISQGKGYFEKMVEKFNVDSTPTVVITNTKTNKAKLFAGYNQISKANFSKEIDKMNSKK